MSCVCVSYYLINDSQKIKIRLGVVVDAFNKLNSYVIFFFFFPFCCAVDGTQGFLCAGPVLYH